VPPPAPLVGPQTEDEWLRATMKAIHEKNPSEATKQEYRKVLERFSGVVSRYGDMALLYRRLAGARFENYPIMEEAVKVQFNTMHDTSIGSGEGYQPGDYAKWTVRLGVRRATICRDMRLRCETGWYSTSRGSVNNWPNGSRNTWMTWSAG